MFKIIEVTRGEKPEGNVLLFGHTIESDFYIKGENCNGYCNFHSYIDKVKNVMSRKNFQRAKDLPLNNTFPKEKDWNY